MNSDGKDQLLWDRAAQVLDPEAVETARRLGMRARDVLDVPEDYRKGWELAMELLSGAEPDGYGEGFRRALDIMRAAAGHKDAAVTLTENLSGHVAKAIDSAVSGVESQVAEVHELATRSLALAESVERRVKLVDERLGLAERAADRRRREDLLAMPRETLHGAGAVHGSISACGHTTSPFEQEMDSLIERYRALDPAALTDEQLDKIAEHLAEPDETRQFQVMVDRVYEITCPQEVGVNEWHEVPAAIKSMVNRFVPDELLLDVYGTAVAAVEGSVNVLEVVPDSEIEPPPTEPVELPFEVEATEAGVVMRIVPRPRRDARDCWWSRIRIASWNACHAVTGGIAGGSDWVKWDKAWTAIEREVLSETLPAPDGTAAGIRLMTAAAKVRRALDKKEKS